MMKTLFAQVEGFIFAFVLLWAGIASLLCAGLLIGIKNDATQELAKIFEEESQ